MFRRPLGWIGAAVLLFGTSAGATPNFPSVVRSELSLSADPPCALCHQGTPMVGTVTTPFGSALRERGLVFYDEPSLRQALTQLEADAVDGDGDGAGDVEELRAGGDPNVAAARPGEPARFVENFGEPTYGCGAAPRTTTGSFSQLVFLAAVLFGVSTRVSRSRSRVGGGPSASRRKCEK